MKALKIWVRAKWMFFKVLFDYRESVIENELTLKQAWDLCHSLNEARYSRGMIYG